MRFKAESYEMTERAMELARLSWPGPSYQANARVRSSGLTAGLSRHLGVGGGSRLPTTKSYSLGSFDEEGAAVGGVASSEGTSTFSGYPSSGRRSKGPSLSALPPLSSASFGGGSLPPLPPLTPSRFTSSSLSRGNNDGHSAGLLPFPPLSSSLQTFPQSSQGFGTPTLQLSGGSGRASTAVPLGGGMSGSLRRVGSRSRLPSLGSGMNDFSMSGTAGAYFDAHMPPLPPLSTSAGSGSSFPSTPSPTSAFGNHGYGSGTTAPHSNHSSTSIGGLAYSDYSSATFDPHQYVPPDSVGYTGLHDIGAGSGSGSYGHAGNGYQPEQHTWPASTSSHSFPALAGDGSSGIIDPQSSSRPASPSLGSYYQGNGFSGGSSGGLSGGNRYEDHPFRNYRRSSNGRRDLRGRSGLASLDDMLSSLMGSDSS